MIEGEPFLKARDLAFGYRKDETQVSVLSFAVPRGALAGLIGPNGSGKSTLLRLLAGVLAPRTGRIDLEGMPLAAIDRRARARRIAYVPQFSTTVFPFTALEVVLTGRIPFGPRFGFENGRDREIALGALAAFGASGLAARPVTELSGGERQLVAVARALAQEAEGLLLDEPSASLDLKHRALLRRVLQEERRARGTTVLVATQDLGLVDRGFDLLFGMNGGRIVAAGPPERVLSEPALARVYDDPGVRARRVEDRIVVWSE